MGVNPNTGGNGTVVGESEGGVFTDRSGQVAGTAGVAAGRPGPTGPAGPEGPQGPQGARGPQGPAGTNGTNGATGAQGPQGRYTVSLYQRAATIPAAPTGTWTESTDTYDNSDSWTISIPTGTEQLWESEGDFDPSGTATTITTWSTAFQSGAQGPAGPRGPQGDPGARGATGAQGDPGAAVTAITIDGGTTQADGSVEYEIEFTIGTGGTATTITDQFTAPQGPQGATGPRGNPGTPGASGATGRGVRDVTFTAGTSGATGLPVTYTVTGTDSSTIGTGTFVIPHSDNTISVEATEFTGDGSSASPLTLVNPFTAAESMKLAGLNVRAISDGADNGDGTTTYTVTRDDATQVEITTGGGGGSVGPTNKFTLSHSPNVVTQAAGGNATVEVTINTTYSNDTFLRFENAVAEHTDGTTFTTATGRRTNIFTFDVPRSTIAIGRINFSCDVIYREGSDTTEITFQASGSIQVEAHRHNIYYAYGTQPGRLSEADVMDTGVAAVDGAEFSTNPPFEDYSRLTDYTVGENVYWNGESYRAVQVNGPATEVREPGLTSSNSYWSRTSTSIYIMYPTTVGSNVFIANRFGRLAPDSRVAEGVIVDDIGDTARYEAQVFNSITGPLDLNLET